MENKFLVKNISLHTFRKCTYYKKEEGERNNERIQRGGGREQGNC